MVPVSLNFSLRESREPKWYAEHLHFSITCSIFMNISPSPIAFASRVIATSDELQREKTWCIWFPVFSRPYRKRSYIFEMYDVI